MNLTCSASPCPVILNSSCVFYEGENLICTGINTNDSLQVVLQKLETALCAKPTSYIFQNGLTETSGVVELGGILIKNTTIDATASYNLNVTGSVPNATRLGVLYVENTNTTAAANGATAIYGKGTSKATGVYGISVDGLGVYGQSTNTYGVRGVSSTTYGVYGQSSATIGVYGFGLTTGVRGQSNAANAYGVIGSGLGTNSNGVWGLGNITNGAGFLGFGYYGFKSEASVPVGAYLTGNLIAADLNSPALPLRSTLDSIGRDGVIDAAAEFKRIDTSVGPAPLAGTGVGTWSFLQDDAGTERRVGVSGYILTDGTAGNIKTLYQHIIESGAGTSTYVHNISYTGQHKFPLYGTGLFTGTPTYSLATTASGDIIEMPLYLSGSGTAMNVPYYTAANTLGNNSSFAYDYNNNVLYLTGGSYTWGTLGLSSVKGIQNSHVHYGTYGDIYWRSANTAGVVVLQNFGGNVLIGTDVNGTSKLHVKSDSSSTGNALLVQNSTPTTIFSVQNAGTITLGDTVNLIVGTTTGTKIGTATSQKIGFWNAAPIAQPTTAVTSATRVGGGGATITDTDTFDGYTIAQVVKALRNAGLLA